MSNFNPDLFVQTDIEGSLSTQYVPIPEGEFNGLVKEVKAREAGSSILLDIFWTIDDESVREATGMAEPQVRQSIFLDIDDNTGLLDMGSGKNIQLGRLREALGQNDGSAWNPNRLEGQVALITVTQRDVREDKEGNALPESDWRTYNDVSGVVAM